MIVQFALELLNIMLWTTCILVRLCCTLFIIYNQYCRNVFMMKMECGKIPNDASSIAIFLLGNTNGKTV